MLSYIQLSTYLGYWQMIASDKNFLWNRVWQIHMSRKRGIDTGAMARTSLGKVILDYALK